MRIADENRIEVLRRAALILERENVRFLDKIVELKQKILELEGRPADALQYELQVLNEELNQLTASLEKEIQSAAEDLEAEDRGGDEQKTKKRRKQTGHGPREQPALPIEPVPHTFEVPELKCPLCMTMFEPWGTDDLSEEIHVFERRFVIRQHVRPKRRCKCGCIDMPALPPRVVPGGRYSTSTATSSRAAGGSRERSYFRVETPISICSIMRCESGSTLDRASWCARALRHPRRPTDEPGAAVCPPSSLPGRALPGPSRHGPSAGLRLVRRLKLLE